MDRRTFIRRSLLATATLPIIGPIISPTIARSLGLTTITQTIRSYDAPTVGQIIPCGARVSLVAVEVFTHITGLAPASSVKTLVSLDDQPLWWEYAPSNGRSAPNYVQFLTAPGIWHFEVSLSGLGAPGFNSPTICEIIKT